MTNNFLSHILFYPSTHLYFISTYKLPSRLSLPSTCISPSPQSTIPRRMDAGLVHFSHLVLEFPLSLFQGSQSLLYPGSRHLPCQQPSLGQECVAYISQHLLFFLLQGCAYKLGEAVMKENGSWLLGWVKLIACGMFGFISITTRLEWLLGTW